MPANGRQHGRCPAALQGKMLAPCNGGTRLCRQWGANSAGVRPSLRAKCWRLVTEAQGFASNWAPTWAVPGCAPRQNVGASQRRHKALPAMGRQLGRCPAAPQGEMLAPRNGYTWLGRQWGANSAGCRLPTGTRWKVSGRRLESRKGEWPRPFSFSSFPQSKASGGTPEAHELLFLCSISIQSISIS